MHETTRRLYCRAGFLFGCLAPTLVVLAWLVILRTPAYRAAQRTAWSEALSRRLGVTVTVDSVSTPEPGLTSLHGVVLADPETGRRLASARQVEMARQGSGWIVYVAQAEAPRATLDRLAHCVQLPLLERSTPQSQALACQLIVDRWQLEGDGPGVSLEDVQFLWEPRETGPAGLAEFRLAGWQMAQPARLTVTRDRKSETPTTIWTFDTGPRALPATVLAAFHPALESLGDEAMLSGAITWTATPSGSQGEAQGRLTQVDLDRLFTGRFPHKLTGAADIVATQLQWHDGRITEATGSLTSGGGVVSHSLVIAAASPEGLGLEAPARLHEGKQALWRYQRLAIGFELTDQGLQLRGQCHDSPEGTLIADGTGPLLAESAQPITPVVQLVRTLAPQNEIQVPASQQTERLLRWLPLPPVVPVPAKVARPLYSPLRLR